MSGERQRIIKRLVDASIALQRAHVEAQDAGLITVASEARTLGKAVANLIAAVGRDDQGAGALS